MSKLCTGLSGRPGGKQVSQVSLGQGAEGSFQEVTLHLGPADEQRDLAQEGEKRLQREGDRIGTPWRRSSRQLRVQQESTPRTNGGGGKWCQHASGLMSQARECAFNVEAW